MGYSSGREITGITHAVWSARQRDSKAHADRQRELSEQVDEWTRECVTCGQRALYRAWRQEGNKMLMRGFCRAHRPGATG